ncbi:MAG: hypothetical protein CMG74_13130 [Candidatus Marinimicrobia bacterium]|nr:hypothetical protein [Candidatus Neomarinimicrobiota bacterium]|tara:strand:+ start:52681 stop:54855 length:2175 start_codon:yes stop_codon:yes gene_type:complete
MNKKLIIATLGPTSLNKKVVKSMDNNGVDIFRLNLSHTDIDNLKRQVLELSKWTNKPICLDTEGRQLRTRKLIRNNLPIKSGEIINLLSSNKSPQNENEIPLSVIAPDKILSIGDLLSIDFDSVILQIIDKGSDNSVIARVVSGGIIGSNKGIHFPNEKLLPAFTEKDILAFKIANDLRIKTFALSFASDAKSIKQLREHFNYEINIISKVENDLALQNLAEICDASDSILIDRGDLSRYVPIEKIIFAQQYIVKFANSVNKDVYIATNLMESMINNSYPTRAEIHDIVASLNENADGLILAAETAIGKYPIETIRFVSQIINEVNNTKDKSNIEYLTSVDHNNLIEPHGGQLIQQHINDLDEVSISELTELEVDQKTFSDIIHICEGTFSPLTSFMDVATIQCVLDNNELINGAAWTLPIIFQISKENIEKIKGNSTIGIKLKGNKDISAILNIQNIEKLNISEKLLQKWFGTCDEKHVGVKEFCNKGEYILSGQPYLMNNNASAFEIYPKQTRGVFSQLKWENIVGFHTRNVIHNGHEFIQKKALEMIGADALLISPVVGEKKKGDFSGKAILECYNKMITEEYYKPYGALLSAFNTYSRYSGPREAVFTAICRKNFGCNYFIVGRDHTGLGDYYNPYDSHDIFENLDLGIIILSMDKAYLCNKCERVTDDCSHNNKFHSELSGTVIRDAIVNDNNINNLMRPEIASLLKEFYKHNPKDVFF